MSPSKRSRHVILANGFFPFEVSLRRIAAVYRSKGFEVHIVPFEYADVTDTVTYARHVAELAAEASADAGTKVDVVGISMGGIASYYAARHFGLAALAENVVAVGSPFFGTPIAVLGLVTPPFTKTGEQLRIGSEFLRKLRADGKWPRGPRYVTVGGVLDFICPPWSTLLDGAENLFGIFAHHDTVFSVYLHAAIADLLLGKR